MRSSATGRRLVDPKGGSFFFDAGAVCLDFAHSGGEGRYAVFETLHKPAQLAEWLAQPPLAAVLTVPASGGDLAAAKTLRRIDWFEVVETRGHVADGKVAHFQVTVRVGFRLE